MNTPSIKDVFVSSDELQWKRLRDGYDFKLLRTCSVTETMEAAESGVSLNRLASAKLAQ